VTAPLIEAADAAESILGHASPRHAPEPVIVSPVLVYAIIDPRSSPNHPLGDAVETFVRREDAERFIEEVRGDEPDLASYLRIEGAGAGSGRVELAPPRQLQCVRERPPRIGRPLPKNPSCLLSVRDCEERVAVRVIALLDGVVGRGL
jgi:hypothetical protein